MGNIELEPGIAVRPGRDYTTEISLRDAFGQVGTVAAGAAPAE